MTIITKCDNLFHYIVRHRYYIVRQLLQSATILLQNAIHVGVLQSATEHTNKNKII